LQLKKKEGRSTSLGHELAASPGGGMNVQPNARGEKRNKFLLGKSNPWEGFTDNQASKPSDNKGTNRQPRLAY